MRSPSFKNNGVNYVKKGTWTAEEDIKLVNYIRRYGIWNWAQMPKAAGLERTGKSCRLRWMNYLRPNIKRGNFSKEEEETILQLHQTMGSRWSAIAAKLPGRTDNEIKNHYNTHLKKRFRNKNNINNPYNSNTQKSPESELGKKNLAMQVYIDDMLDQESFEVAQTGQESFEELINYNNLENVENTSSSSVDSTATSEINNDDQSKLFEGFGDFWDLPELVPNFEGINMIEHYYYMDSTNWLESYVHTSCFDSINDDAGGEIWMELFRQNDMDWL